VYGSPRSGTDLSLQGTYNQLLERQVEGTSPQSIINDKKQELELEIHQQYLLYDVSLHLFNIIVVPSECSDLGLEEIDDALTSVLGVMDFCVKLPCSIKNMKEAKATPRTSSFASKKPFLQSGNGLGDAVA
ncbi:hypothetical protein HPP92_006541, partial [Vanilla planifolia]